MQKQLKEPRSILMRRQIELPIYRRATHAIIVSNTHNIKGV